jgi:phytoene synthase
LLPASCRDEVAVLYAYCRRADDSVDESPEGVRAESVARLRRELDAVYAREPQSDALLAEFQRVVLARGIPAEHPHALLDGLASDVGRVRIRTIEELLLYSHRVAGVVGLMLCQVFGVTDRRALAHADDLGIAMQLTNVCRDVVEDWARDRVYLPGQWLARPEVALAVPEQRPAVAEAVKSALALAERVYASGDAGLPALSFRVAIAVRAARNVYAAIGDQIARRGYDVFRGRAVVPAWTKLWLILAAVVAESWARARFVRRPRRLAAELDDGR